MADIKFIRSLRDRLKLPLPGWEAQRILIPEGRESGFRLDNLHPAAVLIALYPERDEWYFPLIQRSIDGFAHSGQIALPGGRREGLESNIETALREAEEEVSLPATEMEILGETSPLPIPVSRHLVQPVIGFIKRKPKLVPDPKEVAHIFSVSLDTLLRVEPKLETREIKGRSWEIPYFEVEGHKVWGATAMILSEFREIISKLNLTSSNS